MQESTTQVQEDPYQYETNTFRLEVSIFGEKLKIKLKDFIDWIIYEKEYSDDDIGKG